MTEERGCQLLLRLLEGREKGEEEASFVGEVVVPPPYLRRSHMMRFRLLPGDRTSFGCPGVQAKSRGETKYTSMSK